MSIAGKITDFIKTCPFLQDFESMFPKVDFDNLEEDGNCILYRKHSGRANFEALYQWRYPSAICFLPLLQGMVRTRREPGYLRVLREIRGLVGGMHRKWHASAITWEIGKQIYPGNHRWLFICGTGK